MNDIKPYARNELDIDSLIHATRIYSSDTGIMILSLAGWYQSGKMIRSKGVELPEGSIVDVQDS